MKITIEGEPKEIAALVLELQERRAKSIDAANGNAYNLVIKNDEIRDIKSVFAASKNRYVF